MAEEHHALEEHGLLALLFIIHPFDLAFDCLQSLEDLAITLLIHFFRNYKLQFLLNMLVKVFYDELDHALHAYRDLRTHLFLD